MGLRTLEVAEPDPEAVMASVERKNEPTASVAISGIVRAKCKLSPRRRGFRKTAASWPHEYFAATQQPPSG